jgi:hypothetical protein
MCNKCPATQQELFSTSETARITQRSIQQAKSARKKRYTSAPISLKMTAEGQPVQQYAIDKGQWYQMLAYRAATGMPIRTIVRRALAEFLERHRVGRTTDAIQ